MPYLYKIVSLCIYMSSGGVDLGPIWALPGLTLALTHKHPHAPSLAMILTWSRLHPDPNLALALTPPPHRILSQLKSLGLAGVVAYGLLNTLYYTAAFMFVWLYVAKVPTGGSDSCVWLLPAALLLLGALCALLGILQYDLERGFNGSFTHFSCCNPTWDVQLSRCACNCWQPAK